MENMGVDLTFWRNKSVFITGHTGFKGGWLALWLQALDARVTGYALAPETTPNFFTVARVSEGMESKIGNVLDQSRLLNTMGAAKTEIAFHLAAQPLVGRSLADPVETFDVNVMGTVHFLEAVRKVPTIRVAIVVTSDKCYKILPNHPAYTEDDAMGGDDPYSSSKGCAELVVNAYRRSFFEERGVQLASVRAGNVLGGGDWSDQRLVPDLVRALCEEKAMNLRYPSAVRPWQHVLDPLCGYLQLAEQMYDNKGRRYASGWNFGPNEGPRTVLEVVEKTVELWGEGKQGVQTDKPRHAESEYLMINAALAREKIGWRSRLDFEKMLQWTIQWYRKCLASENDMRTFSLNQILQYCQL